MFQLAFACTADQMSRSFPSSRRSTYRWRSVGGKMSDRNQEKLLNTKFCVNVGKRNRMFLNGTGGSMNGEMCKMTQEVGSQKRKGQMQMWTEYKSWFFLIEV
jgi:hypothetical protein